MKIRTLKRRFAARQNRDRGTMILESVSNGRCPVCHDSVVLSPDESEAITLASCSSCGWKAYLGGNLPA